MPIEGVPVAAGGDVMFMPDPALNTGYFGLTGNVGFGTPGKEFHVEWGTTVTLPYTQFNVYEVARSVYIKIGGQGDRGTVLLSPFFLTMSCSHVSIKRGDKQCQGKQERKAVAAYTT